jgi:hypothetical protein
MAALRLAPVEDEMIEHLDDVERGSPNLPVFSFQTLKSTLPE